MPDSMRHRFFLWLMGIGAFGRIGHLLGYARVLTGDQDAALQQDALKAAGCSAVKHVPNNFLLTAALVQLSALSSAACAPDPTQPDVAKRDTFAKRVVTAAASGSVEQVEKLVPEVYANVRPDAQLLVDSIRGWDPSTVELRVRSDFPELAQVEALRPGAPAGAKFTVAWGTVTGHW